MWLPLLKTNKNTEMKHSIFPIILALLVASGCSKAPVPDNTASPDDKPIVVPDEKSSSITWSPEEPDADKPLTITFRAGTSSKLYGYKGDVYAHIGIVEFGTWKFVPAEWTENIPKCKFTPDREIPNQWTIALEPSIREYFGSGSMSISQIGIVIRSSDSSRKGIEQDSFIPVTDNLYESFEPSEPVEMPLPEGMAYGINITDNSTATFVLHDCDTKSAHHDYAYIIGDFNNWTLSNDGKSRMYRDNASGTWWITVSGLDPSKEYRFQYHIGDTDGGPIRIGDAFSEKVLDPDNDRYIPATTYNEDMTYPKGASGIVSVFRTSDDAYNWEVQDFRPDRDLVIYEILLRDFTSGKDLNGAMEKLDYLKDLGVNAIELMPVQEFDGNNSWGYNPSYYFALDKAYGTRLMFKKFIDECHKRGMAVILDVVYNHNTGNSPLAKLYWDSANNRTAANNPYFNVTAPHPFSVFHDFNHENSFVRELVKRSTEYLMEEYNVDGFRFDLTKGFTQRQCTASTAPNYDAGRIAILKDYCSSIRSVKEDAIVILEHFCSVTEERELAEAGMTLWRNMNNAYCQTAMGWPADSDLSGLYCGTSMPSGSLVGFMESHDEERTCYKQIAYGNSIVKTDLAVRMQRAALNAAFFLTVPGPKMIWQFGEMGYDISIEHNGRTGEKPLHWEYLDNQYRAALHSTYRRLLEFRRGNPEFFDGTASFSWNVGASAWAAGRSITCTSGEKSFAVIGNFDMTAHEITAELPEGGQWKDIMNPENTIQVSGNSVTMELPAGGFCMMANF